MTDPITDNYYTKTELAERLDKSPRTLDRWAEMREGPPRFRFGNVILYPKAGTLEWIESRTHKMPRA